MRNERFGFLSGSLAVVGSALGASSDVRSRDRRLLMTEDRNGSRSHTTDHFSSKAHPRLLALHIHRCFRKWTSLHSAQLSSLVPARLTIRLLVQLVSA